MQAIDAWLGLCTAFVFAALVEFTIVNFWFRKARSGRAGYRWGNFPKMKLTMQCPAILDT